MANYYTSMWNYFGGQTIKALKFRLVKSKHYDDECETGKKGQGSSVTPEGFFAVWELWIPMTCFRTLKNTLWGTNKLILLPPPDRIVACESTITILMESCLIESHGKLKMLLPPVLDFFGYRPPQANYQKLPRKETLKQERNQKYNFVFRSNCTIGMYSERLTQKNSFSQGLYQSVFSNRMKLPLFYVVSFLLVHY